MPLAIVLAAAGVEYFSPSEIAAEISNDIAILNSKDIADLPSRQQSMQAVFNHSWSLLTAAEQQSFARMSIFRSHLHTYVQLIDDSAGKTLVSASSIDGDLKGSIKYGGNKDAAEIIGKTVAERALSQGIKQVCFDRGSCKYHGRVAALADAAREAGLQF